MFYLVFSFLRYLQSIHVHKKHVQHFPIKIYQNIYWFTFFFLYFERRPFYKEVKSLSVLSSLTHQNKKRKKQRTQRPTSKPTMALMMENLSTTRRQTDSEIDDQSGRHKAELTIFNHSQLSHRRSTKLMFKTNKCKNRVHTNYDDKKITKHNQYKKNTV